MKNARNGIYLRWKGIPKLKTIHAFYCAFMNMEATAVEKYDESRHWLNHPERTKWRAIGAYEKKYPVEKRGSCDNCGLRNPIVRRNRRFCSNECGKAFNKRERLPRTEAQRERRRIYLRAHDRKLRQTNPTYVLKQRLKARLHKVLQSQGLKKRNRTSELLGCDAETLRRWIEAKFKPGMSWRNKGAWHIDHVIPISSFNLSDPRQILIACHYTNLQPLWAKANMSKGAKIIPHQQELTINV